MRDYRKSCYYEKKLETGERACPFNALYRNFFARNQATLGNNFRLGRARR